MRVWFRSNLKRFIVGAYCHGVIGTALAQRLIEAFGLQEA